MQTFVGLVINSVSVFFFPSAYELILIIWVNIVSFESFSFCFVKFIYYCRIWIRNVKIILF